MVSISLQQLGKKFRKEWIFRGLDTEIPSGTKLVILGGNGSGKSTLLQVISGFVSPNEGQVVFKEAEKIIDAEETRNYISFASPYLQLIEDFSASELVDHVRMYKPFINQISTSQILALTGLPDTADKPVRQFSSGMKQRLKLGLAILSDTPVLLLDEPISNLDRNAVKWYRELLEQYSEKRTVIVCSNAITEEYAFCERELNVMDYKQGK
jgi:ABC-type multidrug transport system ATPase subunit